jgi:prepilin-type N-terminal cleavage/methylation domain-containing protein
LLAEIVREENSLLLRLQNEAKAELNGGDKEARTPDPLLAKQVLYQLSYIPEKVKIDLKKSSERKARQPKNENHFVKVNFFQMIKKIFRKNRSNRKTAFTLIEMSIVILIASILITGLLSASVSSISNTNIKVTNERLKEIYKALGNFVAVNGRLPCPASLKKVKSVDTDYGAEVERGSDSNICVGASDVGVYESNANDKLVYGAVPVKALGLSSDMAEDGFGNKIAYIMNQDFADNFPAIGSINFSGESFPVAAYNTLQAEAAIPQDPAEVLTIQEKKGASDSVASAYAIVALVSYGPNKIYAFNANSAVQNAATSSDAGEISNGISSIGTTDAAYDGTLVASSDSSDVFDDIVLFKTTQNFVEDFNLMFLIPCKDAGSTNGFANKNAYYGQKVYGAECALPANGSYTKKCEAYGRWVDVNTCS